MGHTQGAFTVEGVEERAKEKQGKVGKGLSAGWLTSQARGGKDAL